MNHDTNDGKNLSKLQLKQYTLSRITEYYMQHNYPKLKLSDV